MCCMKSRIIYLYFKHNSYILMHSWYFNSQIFTTLGLLLFSIPEWGSSSWGFDCSCSWSKRRAIWANGGGVSRSNRCKGSRSTRGSCSLFRDWGVSTFGKFVGAQWSYFAVPRKVESLASILWGHWRLTVLLAHVEFNTCHCHVILAILDDWELEGTGYLKSLNCVSVFSVKLICNKNWIFC